MAVGMTVGSRGRRAGAVSDLPYLGLCQRGKAAPLASSHPLRMQTVGVQATAHHQIAVDPRRVTVTSETAALRHHVGHVLEVRPQEQMAGVTAGRIVAVVADELTRGDGSVDDRVGDPAGGHPLALIHPGAVAGGQSLAQERPALVRTADIDQGPETAQPLGVTMGRHRELTLLVKWTPGGLEPPGVRVFLSIRQGRG